MKSSLLKSDKLEDMWAMKNRSFVGNETLFREGKLIVKMKDPEALLKMATKMNRASKNNSKERSRRSTIAKS